MLTEPCGSAGTGPEMTAGVSMHKQALWWRGCEGSGALTAQLSLLGWRLYQPSGIARNKTVRKEGGRSPGLVTVAVSQGCSSCCEASGSRSPSAVPRALVLWDLAP